MNILPRYNQEAVNPIGNADYKDDDGLIICGVCGERKQKRISLPWAGEERIASIMCKCRREEKERIEKDMQETERRIEIEKLRCGSLMSKKLSDATFEHYRDMPENEKIKHIAETYVDKFFEMEERNQGLLLYGSVGTGKSYTAACIANRLMDNGVSVVMTSFVRILQDIRNCPDEGQYIEYLNKQRLLIIDDLGAERGTEYALEKVYNIIDGRVRTNKPMILSTNISLDEMMETEDIRLKRIYDRIFEVCFPVEMSWKSLRRSEAASRFADMQTLLEA